VFFTFWGLDVITESKVDHLHVNLAATPARPCPPCSRACPAWRASPAKMMMKQMEELELPTVREMLQILDESGAELYACELAMKMFKREKKDLAPR
jgi:peroxiredoxin family protein